MLELNEILKNTPCTCGRIHSFDKRVITGEGAINQLADIIKSLGAKHIFAVSDKNTQIAAGEQVYSILNSTGIKHTDCCFDKDETEPNEESVGYALMYFTPDCDAIIGIGSGVINDICKIIANTTGKPYIIVATAPSMDGYASESSSMTRNGLKISLPSKCPDVIIGDTDILCKAPLKMMKSGLGDMLAKYVSIAEWRIANIITGEYYCEDVAELIRTALKKCTDNASGLLKRDKAAVSAVFEGLVAGGIAMNIAGVSRPASGMEHYISHIWDMRGAEFNLPVEFHGIQCAVGTLMTAKLYERLLEVTPDRQKAIAYVQSFDFENWSHKLREFLGKSAENMIALEAKEKKYNKDNHKSRLEIIIDNIDTIKEIIREEIPSVAELEALYRSIGLPETAEEVGIEPSLIPITLEATKDMRDKYVLSRLIWDLGLTEEFFYNK